MPGGRWDRELKVWKFPLSWTTCVQLRGTFGDDLAVGLKLNAWARADIETRIKPCLELREASDAPELAMFTELFPYQRAGVRFKAAAGCALNADEMGLGKTVQGIATTEVLNAYPSLVVCPNSVKAVWYDEYEKWNPGRNVVVIDGGAATRRKQIDIVGSGEADVAVINWDVLRQHTRLGYYPGIKLADGEKEEKELNEIAWAVVHADEAHRGKDPTSKWTRALWGVSRDAPHRFAYTGTPIAGSPEDLWAIMHFVMPSEWPTKGKFIDRYALQSWNAFGFMSVIGIKGEMRDELFKILDPRMIRRLKEVVLSDPKQAVYIPEKLPPERRMATLAGKQKKAYDQMRKDMLAELDDGVVMAGNPLTRLTRLIQFASACGELSPATFDVVYTSSSEGNILNVPVQTGFETYEDAAAFQAGTPEFDGKKTFVQPGKRQLTLTMPSCKVDVALELAEELGGQQAVFFAESRQLIELTHAALVNAGYTAEMITGSIPTDIRALNVRKLQAGDIQFLLLTLGAGGEGLTLTAASTAIFLQRSFSLVKNLQAEDRLHRPGQKNMVRYIDVVTEGTVEARVHELARDKEARLEEIVRDEEQLRRMLK